MTAGGAVSDGPNAVSRRNVTLAEQRLPAARVSGGSNARRTGRAPFAEQRLPPVRGGARNPRWRARRLQAVADRIGRTLGAVRKRAQRLGERSYRPSWSRAVSVAAGRQAERQFSRLRATDQRAATEGRRRHHQGGGEAAAGRHAGGAGFPSGGVR